MMPTHSRFFYRKPLLALLVFSLVAAACGGDSSPDQTATTAPATTATAPQTTTSTTVVPTTTAAAPQTTTTAADPAVAFEPAVVSYRYPSSGEIAYDVSIQQQADVTLEGGPPEQMPPGPIQISSTLVGTINYQTSPGPGQDTTSIRILSDFELVENKMSMGGITMPDPGESAVPGFEAPIDITVVVDQQGNVLEISSEALESLFGGDSFLSGASMGSQELNRPFGPAFPDHPIGIGDTWSERIEQEGPVGLGSIVTNAEHRLVGVDEIAGRTVLVVESEYRTEGFEWDMSEFLKGFFGAFSDGFSEGEAQEGLEAISELKLLVRATPSTVIAVTRFDSEAGLVLEGDYQVQGEVTTDMTIPDETGDTTSIVSTTYYDQTVTYELISPTT